MTCTSQLGCLAPKFCGPDYCRHEHSTMSCTSHAAIWEPPKVESKT